ncbi:MAG: hypothetical protein KBF43_15055 [Dermatophilaceae bacterium]|uniref:HEPN domain-containing protein n=1 Tax=Candidatus Phosphoribacter hodrii TaxID=2953743 RepID=A0A934X3Z1_9MICO|nr:hypothetical protein [Candidatus Phosphoribacter hodrii]MBP9919901.1 hypothetical protein [Dermatophilaceae bacterium]OPZ50966.1 MAG: hypothetical protein BWY91_02758 [bacterium ADurb.BinA028]MBK7273409.1 hypothetical protein [Candidatus Phosphoribacter hodrii]MBL0005492.1 hypothetical protein [Candidatus Phosphoribacter hodrii]
MVTPRLRAEQRKAIDALIVDRRLEPVPVDDVRANAFLTLAEDTLIDVAHVRLPQNRYNLAYDASHAVGEALLARYGYRTRSGPGQHEALARFLRIVLDTPPQDADARHFDRMRRARNQMHYEARPVSTADADKAARTALALLSAATPPKDEP